MFLLFFRRQSVVITILKHTSERNFESIMLGEKSEPKCKKTKLRKLKGQIKKEIY